MGQLVAEWIVEGVPSLDVWEMDSRRFGAPLREPGVHARAHRRGLLDLLRRQVPRPRAPGGTAASALADLSSACAELGAAFGEKSGWERANWFEPNAERGDESLRPRGWAGRLWSPAIGAEHRACREAAALFDETSFAKIEVAGAGAAEFLERLCDNRVARDVGAVTYTQMLNARGGIECDFTVTRLADDRFRIVTGTAFGRHDLAWIRSHAPEDGSVQRRGRDLALACLGLWGPRRARDPPASHDRRPLERGVSVHARAGDRRRPGARASRCASPTSASSAGSSTARWSSASGSGTRSGTAGREHGLVAGGYKAIDSLRLEKGYRVWGADITPDDTPYEAGLGFAVKLDKGDFLGREALSQRAGARAAARLHHPRRPARRRARLGAGARRGRDRRAGDERRLRLHGRALDRVRVPPSCALPSPARPVEVEIFGEWVAGRGRCGAALGFRRRADPQLAATSVRVNREVLLSSGTRSQLPGALASGPARDRRAARDRAGDRRRGVGRTGVSKPAVTKHVKALEDAGVVSRTVAGRTHVLRLEERPLREASKWLELHRSLWEAKFEAVERHLAEANEGQEVPE